MIPMNQNAGPAPGQIFMMIPGPGECETGSENEKINRIWHPAGQ
jgi:hypothetical protein